MSSKSVTLPRQNESHAAEREEFSEWLEQWFEEPPHAHSVTPSLGPPLEEYLDELAAGDPELRAWMEEGEHLSGHIPGGWERWGISLKSESSWESEGMPVFDGGTFSLAVLGRRYLFDVPDTDFLFETGHLLLGRCLPDTARMRVRAVKELDDVLR